MGDVEITPYKESWSYHSCAIKNNLKDTRYGKGSLWHCDVCGTWWMKEKCIPQNQPLSMFAGEWMKVYWWMWRTKKRIRALEREKDDADN